MIRKDRDECRDGNRLEYCIRMYRQGVTEDPLNILNVSLSCKAMYEAAKRLEVTSLSTSDWLSVADTQACIVVPKHHKDLRRVMVSGTKSNYSKLARPIPSQKIFTFFTWKRSTFLFT